MISSSIVQDYKTRSRQGDHCLPSRLLFALYFGILGPLRTEFTKESCRFSVETDRVEKHRPLIKERFK